MFDHISPEEKLRLLNNRLSKAYEQYLSASALLLYMSESSEAVEKGKVPLPSAVLKLPSGTVELSLNELSEKSKKQFIEDLEDIAGTMMIESLSKIRELCDEIESLFHDTSSA